MKGIMSIRYTSGQQEKFEVDLWAGEGASARLQAFINAPAILLQTETELLIVRQSAVESISLAVPKEDKTKFRLPDIRAAKRLK